MKTLKFIAFCVIMAALIAVMMGIAIDVAH